MHFLLISMAALMLPSLAGCEVVTGSGELMTWEIDQADFARLEIGYAFDVEITRSDSYQLTVTIDKTLNEYLEVEKRGDALYLGLESGRIYSGMTRRAAITLPDLRRLKLSGASSGVVSGFTTSDSMEFELSGASTLEIIDLQAGNTRLALSGDSEVTGRMLMDEASIDLSGGSSLQLEGSANQLNISASGESTVDLPDFPVPSADVNLSGASKAVINVSDSIDINLSGGSTLDYFGSPRLRDIDISGGSKVNRR